MKHSKNVTDSQSTDVSIAGAKAPFATHNSLVFPTGRLDLATLQFDSVRQPAVPGMRSGRANARQLLYKSGNFCIDMCLQPTPGSESIVLIGQLLDSVRPGNGISGIPVSLLSHGGMVCRKQTNDAGEFDFDIELLAAMQLVFRISDKRSIVVSVPDEASRSHQPV